MSYLIKISYLYFFQTLLVFGIFQEDPIIKYDWCLDLRHLALSHYYQTKQ